MVPMEPKNIATDRILFSKYAGAVFTAASVMGLLMSAVFVCLYFTLDIANPFVLLIAAGLVFVLSFGGGIMFNVFFVKKKHKEFVDFYKPIFENGIACKGEILSKREEQAGTQVKIDFEFRYTGEDGQPVKEFTGPLYFLSDADRLYQRGFLRFVYWKEKNTKAFLKD